MKTKRIVTILLAVLWMTALVSCNGKDVPGGGAADTDPLTNKLSSEEIEALINPDFSSSPYERVDESLPALSTEQLKAIISLVPTDKYEQYPHLHDVPLSATLYKDGETTRIDVADPRLIGLINLYNNSVYHRQYAYTQGLLNIDAQNEVWSESFKLVITFEPKEINNTFYDTNITAYDTFIVTNESFTLINHSVPGYDQEEYPHKAVGHVPLYGHYAWLDLFGF